MSPVVIYREKISPKRGVARHFTGPTLIPEAKIVF